MDKYDDIPRDLIERAIAELNREIPAWDVLVEQLGEFGLEVEAFVRRLENIKFFAHVGEPIKDQSKGKFERVENWDAAIRVSLEESAALMERYFRCAEISLSSTTVKT